MNAALLSGSRPRRTHWCAASHRYAGPALAAALLLALAMSATADELLLRRYEPIEVYKDYNPGVTAMPNDCRYTYMDVEDTYLSATQPAANFGASRALRIADARDRILIAFRILYRVVPPDWSVDEATLVLVPTAPLDPQTPITVRRVLLPWRDGGRDGAYQPVAANFNARYAGEGAFQRPWTAPGGDTDCAPEPSLTGKLGDFWDAQRQAYVLKGPGLLADVRYWHTRHYRNYGWMIAAGDGGVPGAAPSSTPLPSREGLGEGSAAAEKNPHPAVPLGGGGVADAGTKQSFAGTPTQDSAKQSFAGTHTQDSAKQSFAGTNFAVPEVAFFASEVLDAAQRPALQLTISPPGKQVLKERKRPDLDVTYIERTPRYSRYNDNGQTTYFRREFRGDMPGVMIDPDYDQYQKHPQEGDLVTFTAHVKNASDEPFQGPVSYRWRINDRTVLEAATQPLTLGPWEEFTTRLEWEWHVDLADHRKVVLEFEVDPEDKVVELSEHNNAVLKYVAAKTLKYWVEKSAYEYVQDYVTCWGSLSFEDYLQWHMDVWNETYFDKSRFDDCAPDGTVLRATLDAFEVVPDGLLGGGIHRSEDRLDPLFDGEWGTEYEGADKPDGKPSLNWENFVRGKRVVLEPSLLHEGSHQVWGAYDVYWSNIEYSEPNDPRGKCKVKDESGFYIPRGDWYIYSGLMGGEDNRPNPAYWEGTGLYEATSILGANANARFRNGFYGDWQYDLPRECCIQLTSRDGTPLKGAKITLWQQTWKGILNENLVAENVPVGDDGVVKLPDQESGEPADVSTLTGHTLLAKNPWGRIDVVGQNITLLVQVNACGQRDYQFVRVHPFNRAYAAGHRDRYVLPLACRISPSDKVDLKTNVAAGAKVTASLAPEQAAALVDGKVETHWRGGRAEKGAYVEIELKQPQRVGVVQIVQDGAYGAFFRRFAITTRTEAGAAPEPFDQQVPQPFNFAMGNEKDVNYARPSEHWVTYAAPPRVARFIRIAALDGGETDVSEVRVFAE